MSTPAYLLRVENIAKTYRIYEKSTDRLKALIAPWTKPYRDHAALKNVSFELHAQETLGVLGRNGAGKSTLLQIIAGVLKPTRGAIDRRGRVAALLELSAGFNPDLSGYDNARLSAALNGLSGRRIKEIMPDVVAFSELGDFIHAPLKTYSSGMKARLGFAVMMHVDADIVIIDETLAVGDQAFRQKSIRAMKNFVREKALIFVSHSPELVAGLCERCLWIDRGSVREVGPTKAVVESYMRMVREERSGPMRIQEAEKPSAAPTAGSLSPASRPRIMPTSDVGVEIFETDLAGPARTRGSAEIERVAFEATARPGARIVHGGDEVQVTVAVRAVEGLNDFIVGFEVRNAAGLAVFGQNTLAAAQTAPRHARKGDLVRVLFRFTMPHLRKGSYALAAAVALQADGVIAPEARQDEAVFFEVHERDVVRGLVGVPMHAIDVTVAAGDDRENGEAA